MYGERTLFDGEAKENFFVDASFLPIPEEVSRAAISRRPRDFYLACRDSGHTPMDDDHLVEMYEQGRFEYEQEQGAFPVRSLSLGLENSVSVVESKPTRPRKSNGKTKINYDIFGREVVRNRSWMNMENIFLHTEVKREILRRAGYTHLKGAKGERVTIESATSSRIGQTFANVYLTWQRKL